MPTSVHSCLRVLEACTHGLGVLHCGGSVWCDDVETAYVMSAIRFCRLTHSVSKAAFSSIVCVTAWSLRMVGVHWYTGNVPIYTVTRGLLYFKSTFFSMFDFLYFFVFQGFPQELGFWPPRGTSQKKVKKKKFHAPCCQGSRQSPLRGVIWAPSFPP